MYICEDLMIFDGHILEIWWGWVFDGFMQSYGDMMGTLQIVTAMISRIWAAIWIYSWEYETNKFLKIYWEIRWMQTQPCESNTVAGMGQIVNVPVRARWFCRIWSHPELRFFSAAVFFLGVKMNPCNHLPGLCINKLPARKAARNSLPQLLKLRHVIWLKYIPSGNLT